MKIKLQTLIGVAALLATVIITGCGTTGSDPISAFISNPQTVALGEQLLTAELVTQGGLTPAQATLVSSALTNVVSSGSLSGVITPANITNALVASGLNTSSNPVEAAVVSSVIQDVATNGTVNVNDVLTQTATAYAQAAIAAQLNPPKSTLTATQIQKLIAKSKAAKVPKPVVPTAAIVTPAAAPTIPAAGTVQ
jgi:hypothetical protein